MNHPPITAAAGIQTSKQAWSIISPDTVASLQVATGILLENGNSLAVRRKLLDARGQPFASIVDASLQCPYEEIAGLQYEAANVVDADTKLH